MTRRAMLALLPTSLHLAAEQSLPRKSKPLPMGSELVRLLDPVTEMPVTRLTSPVSNSFLPVAANQFVSTKDRFLVFSSDRTGHNAPFRLDLRTGALSQLGPTDDVCPPSLCLDASNRILNLLDRSTLKEIGLNGKRIHVLGENVTAFSFGSSTADLVVVSGSNLYLGANQSTKLVEDVAGWCMVRPAGSGCLFGREASAGEREFWYVPLSGAQPKTTLLAKGRISNPYWSPDGRSVLFLREISDGNFTRSVIHEVFPETCQEQHVTNTSQFASFAPNADGSVFVGASRSKAQPVVVLLLRSSRRELTLCEHGAKNAAAVSPVFSPDSRRVYFQSDREGKSALYSVNVESLIEST
ncbi:MAG: PD40 domain-containing protein [Acidobacteriaceae bacterium]|nr:PD40 domain-containing protein [Acidobacteriaceae bacterium]